MDRVDQYLEQKTDAQVAEELYILVMAHAAGDVSKTLADRSAYLAASLQKDPQVRELILHHCD